MFTGLIEEVGVVRRLERRGDGGRLSIAAQTVLEGTRSGDSIAVDGACLTVVDLDPGGFVVECMPETLALTTLGETATGGRVNLERSLAVGGRLGGHLVLGHVDAVGEIISIEQEGIARRIRISLPETIAGCVAAKGSIAIDGISLTVITVDDGAFEVGIIPHTMTHTTLADARPRRHVNLEADVLARYALRAIQVLQDGAVGGAEETAQAGALTEALLREQGFI